MSYDPTRSYAQILEDVAVSVNNVQKYALAPFVQLVNWTQQQYPQTDPSRNPIYATMVDLIPNDGGPPIGLSGVLDMFLFVNTSSSSGEIWSLDAVYNTTILEEKTVRKMLMQMPAMA